MAHLQTAALVFPFQDGLVGCRGQRPGVVQGIVGVVELRQHPADVALGDAPAVAEPNDFVAWYVHRSLVSQARRVEGISPGVLQSSASAYARTGELQPMTTRTTCSAPSSSSGTRIGARSIVR